MWTDSEDRQRPEAIYYGLASIAIAGVALLMAVPALTLAMWLEATKYPGMSPSEKEMAAYGGYIGAAAVELVCLISVCIAVNGLFVSGRTGEPRVLCWVGVLLTLGAIALWLACALSWHLQAGRFIR